MIDFKPCKGQSRAIGFNGCGNMTDVKLRKYGLCKDCYTQWLISDDPMAKKTFDSFLLKNKKDYEKKVKKEFRIKKREFNQKGSMSNADTYFSRYIRIKNSIDGNCTCYTCGVILPIKELDNGHYMKREHKATRYNEHNCRPQCKKCNGDTKHNGKQVEFRENLCNEIGEEMVIEIEKLSKTSIKADYMFYKKISDYYRERVYEIQKELNVKYW